MNNLTFGELRWEVGEGGVPRFQHSIAMPHQMNIRYEVAEQRYRNAQGPYPVLHVLPDLDVHQTAERTP